MKKFFQSSGGLVVLIALLLAALTLVVSLFFTGSDPIANLVGVVTTPFRNAGAGVADWVEQRAQSKYHTQQLEEEVERLRRELADMEANAREGQQAIEENKNLRELLGLREKRRDLTDLESAYITAHTLSNWESSFTISKGTQHGVEVNQCVIDACGNLVGVVSDTGLNWATITTLVDTNLDMGGMLARNDTAAILEGDFSLMEQGRLKLSYLPEDTELLAGDVVVTSGKGGVYPSSIVVGTVESMRNDPSGMTRYAIVVPKTDLSALKQVFVIKSFEIVE